MRNWCDNCDARFDTVSRKFFEPDLSVGFYGCKYRRKGKSCCYNRFCLYMMKYMLREKNSNDSTQDENY
jgi:hypothetical protein